MAEWILALSSIKLFQRQRSKSLSLSKVSHRCVVIYTNAQSEPSALKSTNREHACVSMLAFVSSYTIYALLYKHASGA